MKKSNVFLGFAAAILAFAAAGCSGSGKSNTLKVGFVGPLSGGVAVYGVEAKNGAELAVEEINAAGGINGQMIQFISEDDEGDPAKTVSAFKKLTVQDKVQYVVGSLTSGCTKAITDQSQAMKVIQIAPAATATDITIDANGNTWGTNYNGEEIEVYAVVGSLFGNTDMGGGKSRSNTQIGLEKYEQEHAQNRLILKLMTM